MFGLLVIFTVLAILGVALSIVNKNKKQTAKLASELDTAKTQYAWRLEKLKELVTLSRDLAANGNQDAKILMLGIGEYYLNNYLESEPMTVVGHNTFITQYDKFVEQYKVNFNNLGGIIKAVENAKRALKNLKDFDYAIAVADYKTIVFFESPKINVEAEITKLAQEQLDRTNTLNSLISASNPNSEDISKQVTLLENANKALSNFLKTIQANIQFDKAQKKTALQGKDKILSIRKEVQTAERLDGVTEEHLNESEKFINATAALAALSTWGKDLVLDLDTLNKVSTESLQILKNLYDDNKMWKQSRTRQAPPRPGTNSRIGASQVHQDTRTQTRAQIMLHEEQIRKQRHGGSTNISSRTVINGNGNNFDNNNSFINNDTYNPVFDILEDVAVNVATNVIVNEVIQPGFGGFGGGDFGGGGASGNWAPTPEPVYQPEPVQQETYQEPYSSGGNDSSDDDDN